MITAKEAVQLSEEATEEEMEGTLAGYFVSNDAKRICRELEVRIELKITRAALEGQREAYVDGIWYDAYKKDYERIFDFYRHQGFKVEVDNWNGGTLPPTTSLGRRTK
ncbi:MAG: hypothetical protein AAB780_01940 [Patescibacteria group bacterium]|mgnify:FL=1